MDSFINSSSDLVQTTLGPYFDVQSAKIWEEQCDDISEGDQGMNQVLKNSPETKSSYLGFNTSRKLNSK